MPDPLIDALRARHVHVHGTEEGPGLACRERRVGECVLAGLERRLAELEAEIARRPPVLRCAVCRRCYPYDREHFPTRGFQQCRWCIAAKEAA